MQTQSRLSSGGSNLVRVGAEEQREQRDHSDGSDGHERNGSEGEQALVLLVHLHRGLNRLAKRVRVGVESGFSVRVGAGVWWRRW